ncbi:MAG: Holliday junction branch migration protein RuvA [Chitinivibrionales bacterium]|nr:Holliday junction branch migration protein RuvA [Chitinivibrionales bacterium]
MIEYIKGTLAAKSSSAATIEAAGVGYGIEIPLSTFEALPDVGKDVKLLTHYHVREDAHKLFGFMTPGERELFRQLIGISQIGPKVALGVLSRVAVADLVDAVARGDTSRLTGVPGIGRKTAERLMVELRGKLKGVGASVDAAPSSGGAQRAPAGVRQEAQEALMALGYNEAQVARALARVAEVIEQSAPVEDWIRKALQVM